MAGDWIKMRVNLWTHPKVARLMKRLSVTRCNAIGALYGAWSVADQHADANGAILMSADDLDDMLDLPGFCAALASVGWLEITSDESLQFVDYAEHNSSTAKQRAQSSKRVTRHRNTTVTQDRYSGSDDVTQQRTREEKRREEDNTPQSPPRGAVPQWVTAAFAAWWECYPKKVNKQTALKAYPKAVKRIEAAGASREQAVEMLMTAVQEYAASDSGKGDFVPNPSTWLNGGKWEDDRSAWKDSKGDKPIAARVPRIEDYQNGNTWNPYE